MSRARPGSAVTLTILFLTFGTVMLDRMMLVFLGPHLLDALDLSAGQIGLLASVSGACWAISSLAFGAVSDRIGRLKVLVPAVFAFSLCSWLSGLAQSFEQMLIIRALLGVAEGPCWSVIMALVEESSEEHRRGRNIGIVNSAGPLFGAAIAPVFASQIATHFSWQWAFFVAGVPGIVLGMLILLFVTEPARERDAAGHAPSPTAADFVKLVRYRNLLLCAVAAVGLATWIHVFSAFAPLYITRVMQQPATTAGFLLGAAGFGGFLWSFFGTRIADHIGRKPAVILFAALCVLQPLLFMTAPLYEWPWIMSGLAALVMAGPAAAAVLIVVIPAETVPRQFTAAAIGFAGIGTELIGATFSPVVGGMLADTYGLAAPMLLATGGAVVLVMIGLMLKETLVRPSAPAVAPAAGQT